MEKEHAEYIQDRCVKMFEDAFNNAHPKIIYYSNELDEVCFYAPKICIDYLQDYHNRNVATPLDTKIMRYRGFKIVEHYLPEVTLAHRDYALFLSQELKSTVPL